MLYYSTMILCADQWVPATVYHYRTPLLDRPPASQSASQCQSVSWEPPQLELQWEVMGKQWTLLPKVQCRGWTCVLYGAPFVPKHVKRAPHSVEA